MGPRDHRIHLGRMDSLRTPPQNHSSTKPSFSGPFVWQKRVPRPKCWPDPSKISPEADFGNFSKSLQKERTAIFSEILSRIHPSKLQTEPRGETHFLCFPSKNQKSGVGNPTFTNYFWGFGPTPGMLGVGSPFSEKMFQKHWYFHGLGATRHSEADEPDEAETAGARITAVSKQNSLKLITCGFLNYQFFTRNHWLFNGHTSSLRPTIRPIHSRY